MPSHLQLYPAYKDSGVAWLGEVPAHWSVVRAKTLLRPVDERSTSGKEELLTVSSSRGVVPRRSANVTMFKAESYVGYKLCWPDDLVINSLWAWARGLGVSQYHGIISSAYGVYRVKNANGLSAKFLGALVRSDRFQWELQVRSKGIWISRLQLTDESFLGAPMPLPPADEQAAIVRFLEHADRKIRRAIRAKQKLVKLLEEEKQAIIHRAVTRGLDPNVRLKPSGVDWLGDVPEHWTPLRLKDVASVQTGITLGKDYRAAQTRRYPYLRVANVQSGRLDLRVIKYIDVPDSEARGATLRVGDVLMTEGGDIDKLGRGCVWAGEFAPCLHQNHIFAVRCGPKLLPRFLAAVMSSQHGRAYFEITAKQTTNLAATNSTTLRALPLFLPSIAEQAQILGAIADDTSALASLVERAAREITLLREYRTRLIADVVTGKLDVREAAARLPDEAPDADDGDEADAEAADEATDSEVDPDAGAEADSEAA